MIFFQKWEDLIGNLRSVLDGVCALSNNTHYIYKSIMGF